MTWDEKRAIRIAEDLLEITVVGRLFMLKAGDDGRWLRSPYASGGYEDYVEQVAFRNNGEEDGYRYDWCLFSDEFKMEARKYLVCALDFYFNFGPSETQGAPLGSAPPGIGQPDE